MLPMVYFWSSGYFALSLSDKYVKTARSKPSARIFLFISQLCIIFHSVLFQATKRTSPVLIM